MAPSVIILLLRLAHLAALACLRFCLMVACRCTAAFARQQAGVLTRRGLVGAGVRGPPAARGCLSLVYRSPFMGITVPLWAGVVQAGLRLLPSSISGVVSNPQPFLFKVRIKTWWWWARGRQARDPRGRQQQRATEKERERREKEGKAPAMALPHLRGK